MNKIYDVNLILSATAPTTRPGVMIANINWNKANNNKGMVIAVPPCKTGAPFATPLKNKCVLGFPIIPLIDSPKLKLYPNETQITETIPADTMLLIIVEIMFLRCTIPP